MKAPFKYLGGKAKLAAKIVAMMPDHTLYVEPFAGAASVFFAKAPVKAEVLNDLDGRIVNFYRVLRDDPDELIRRLSLTPYSRTEYEDCRDNPNRDDPIEAARSFFTQANQAFSGVLRRQSGWSRTRSGQGPGTFAAKVDRLQEVAERLRGVTLESRDALEVAAFFGKDNPSHAETTVMYVDPPYLGSVRPKGQRAYGVEMESDAQHIKLAECLESLDADVLLSGYDCELYSKLYKDWNRYTFTTVATASKENRNARTEIVWTNFELPSETLELAACLPSY